MAMKETLEIEGYFIHFDRTESLESMKKKLTHFYHWARHQGEKAVLERENDKLRKSV